MHRSIQLALVFDLLTACGNAPRQAVAMSPTPVSKEALPSLQARTQDQRFASAMTSRADTTTARAIPTGAVTEIKRTLLTQRTLDDQPGLESRIYLIEFPPGAVAKLHRHSAQCVGYVLEGSFESAFGDDQPTIKHAGEAFVDLANKPHHFKNGDTARPLRFIVAGTFHMDEPLFEAL